VTMDVIERLEENVNLFKMAADHGRGDYKASHIARVLSDLFKIGGVNVPCDDIWNAIKDDGTAEMYKKAIALQRSILSVVFPEPEKKPGTSNKKQTKAD